MGYGRTRGHAALGRLAHSGHGDLTPVGAMDKALVLAIRDPWPIGSGSLDTENRVEGEQRGKPPVVSVESSQSGGRVTLRAHGTIETVSDFIQLSAQVRPWYEDASASEIELVVDAEPTTRSARGFLHALADAAVDFGKKVVLGQSGPHEQPSPSASDR